MGSPDLGIKEELEGLTYYKFLRDLEEKIEEMPIIFPETFASKYTFEASVGHFESFANLSRTGTRLWRHRILQLLRQISPLYSLLKWMKQVSDKSVKSLKQMFTGYTEVERVFIKYGLETQAKVLLKNRIIQSQFLKKS